MDRLIEEVAKETGQPIGLVRNIYKHMFLCVYNTMKRGEYQNILLTGFGKFIVKPTRKRALDKMYHRNGAKNNDKHEEVTQDVS